MFLGASSANPVVFTLQNRGSYNQKRMARKEILVVFTLQNKGSYNMFLGASSANPVVYTLQNRGSYNSWR